MCKFVLVFKYDIKLLVLGKAEDYKRRPNPNQISLINVHKYYYK